MTQDVETSVGGTSDPATPTGGIREEIVYRFERADLVDGWWAWALLMVVVGGILWGVIRLYRRDTLELAFSFRFTLIWLRVITLLGLLFLFFGMQRRTQQLVTRPSEVVILVDTSQSMALPADSRSKTRNRADIAADILQNTPTLETLSQQHRLTVYGFDAHDQLRELEVRVGSGSKPDAASNENASPNTVPTVSKEPDDGFSILALLGFGVLILSVALVGLALLFGLLGTMGPIGPMVMAAAMLMVGGGIALGVSWTTKTDQGIGSLLGFFDTDALPNTDQTKRSSSQDSAPTTRDSKWNDALAASGVTTRIGDAIGEVLTRHDPSTMAGILLITDGQNNFGTPLAASAAIAARNGVSVYPIGLGSSDPPTNVRVADLDVPRRVYPGDSFSMTAVLQASGSDQMTVQVELLDGVDDDQAHAKVMDSREVVLSPNGKLTTVRFELEPDQVGRRRLAIRLVPPPGDQNARDDFREARYEVVARKLKVLAIAGGPMREYRFVRNLLYRDKSIQLDVWLQTGLAGMSQDADNLLTEFPNTTEKLFFYDAIICFDPDWLRLNIHQINLLERWLSEQAGGLVLVAGPVNMQEWTRLRTDPRVRKLAGFFPVNFVSGSGLLRRGRRGGKTQWPLQFSSEALREEFLWITDDAKSSFEAWNASGGVYDFIGTKDAKPGAKVYARFSDPTSAINDVFPVYLASQYYGAGRVYFQGSGEIWRLRSVSDALYDNYFTKLLRWVSEGRLLRDSNRGILLVDQARTLVGETVTVRAILTDAQFEPLQIAEVQADLLTPGGEIKQVRLLPIAGEPRPGTYGGRFVVREAGSYELQVTLGDGVQEQVLRQTVQTRLPTLELERPRREDAGLSTLASVTKGTYLPIDAPKSLLDSADGESAGAQLANMVAMIRPQPQTTLLPGTPDRDFTERRNASLMWLLASCLGFEWVVRRLQRLA